MGAKKNLINQRFGKLLVIQELPKEQRPNIKKVFWLCQCDCGNKSIVQASNLTNGHTTSCGCKRAETMSKTMSKDILGNKYGRLLVIEKTNERYGDGSIIWKCQCDCGNIAYVNTNSLKREDIVSCGCLRSKGERKINELLFDHNVNYKTQFKFTDLRDKSYLFFDFAIFDAKDKLRCLIEYQGIQHYCSEVLHSAWQQSSPLLHDEMKREYCKIHNIPLIEIPYTDYDNLTWEYLKDKLNL